MKQQYHDTGQGQLTVWRPGGPDVLESDHVNVLAGVLPVFDATGQVKPEGFNPAGQDLI